MSTNWRVSDMVVDFLVKNGVDTVFTVTGGGAMFLNDALAMRKQDVRTICNHHEQASAMAAVGYAKLRDSFGTAILTTGCGATNGVTGLLDAWQDNVPCIFISGQVKRKETSRNASVPLRQFGVQEADIIKIVASISKYAVMVNHPEDAEAELEKAARIAVSGRPGPVWLDIPMDVQSALVPKRAPALVRTSALSGVPSEGAPALDPAQVDLVAGLLRQARRPVFIAGNGIRCAGAIGVFGDLARRLRVPVTVSYLGVDIFPGTEPGHVGTLGSKGSRAGNFAVQNSDLVIAVGCRLSVSLTGFEYGTFARDAKICVIDIDPQEHRKQTVRIDHFVHADAGDFLRALDAKTANFPPGPSGWLEKCGEWKQRCPLCSEEQKRDPGGINLYHFVEALNDLAPDDAVFVADAGSAGYVAAQALAMRPGQRYLMSGGQMDMGFTLPAALGACAAEPGRPVIAITGDGSLQMNLQELQTLAQTALPVKLVVWNNLGYLSIRSTQKRFFEGRELGASPASGVSFPDLVKLSAVFGIPCARVTGQAELEPKLAAFLASSGPGILEVMCSPEQEIIPTASSARLPDGRMVSKPLEDMYPFLDRDEFRKEMIVKPLE